MKLTLGFSPCPNDTFIFDALVNGKIDTGGITFDYVMEDVETLNQWAEVGKLDITKLSYNTFLHTIDKYILLDSGSALGVGVGPLLVASKQLDLENIAAYKIAIPGIKTTANLLLSLAFPDAKNKTELIFNEIDQAVLSGKFDAGMMIHEGRFTYEAKGLVKLIDLGDWWEHQMHVPIPLGGIVMKRDTPPELLHTINRLIQQSIDYSWKQYPHLSHFITTNAQEMEEDVMRRHIMLYVNEYSFSLGEAGRHAINTMFHKALAAGLINESYKEYPIFAE